MGVFRNFPYTNFHEMNMDYLLKIVREWIDKTDKYFADNTEAMEYLKENFQELKDYVTNYLQHIDVEYEEWLADQDIPLLVNDKLEQMLADGELDNILANNIVTWDRLHTQQINAKAVFRNRENYFEVATDNTSRHTSVQDGIVYSPSGHYESDSADRYLYVWRVWSDDIGTSLETINISTNQIIGRLSVTSAGHGGTMFIKDDVIYSVANGNLFKISLTNPMNPTLISAEPITLLPKNLIGWNNEGYWLMASNVNDEPDRKRKVYRVDENFTTATYLYNLGVSNDRVLQNISYNAEANLIYVAQTWGNLITMVNGVNGEAIEDYFIPDDIAYINTGELEYISVHDEHIYFGCISTAGVPRSVMMEHVCFYTNPHIMNQSRHINNRVEGQHTVYINTNYKGNRNGLNPEYAGSARNLASGNVVFRYVEDAMNYVKSHNGGIISFSTDYDYGFHVSVPCRININNHSLHAFKLDNNVECLVSGLGNAVFKGEPIAYNYTRMDQTEYLKCFIYVEYGSTLKAVDLGALTINNRADVMIWVNYGTLEVLTRSDLYSVLATNAIITGDVLLTGKIYSRHSLWMVRGVNINHVNTMYFDNDSTLKAQVWRNTSTRTSINDILGKKLPRELLVSVATGSAVAQRPLPVLQIYAYSVGALTIRWGHYTSDGVTYNNINFIITHATEFQRIGIFTRHTWTLTHDSGSLDTIGSYSAIAQFNN